LITQGSIRNRLLSVIAGQSFARLQPFLELVDLPTKSVLILESEPNAHVYFLEGGLASIVARSRQGAEIEVGHIGWEGLAGFHVLLGTDQTLNRTFMQTAGSAWRIPVDELTAATAGDEALRVVLLRYVHAYETQLSHSALANARYSINQRLARWLLMAHDRLDGDDLPLTHEFLSLMLGVRRSGVTTEIHILEGLHLIKANRARIHIQDREGLQKLAGDCYGMPEAEYERLIGIRFSK